MGSKVRIRITLTAALLICILMLTSCGSEVALTIRDQKVTTEVTISAGKTVADALDAAGIVLGDKDMTEPAADTKITEDLSEITINRYALVTFIDGNKKTEAEVTGGTVGDALDAAGITLGGNDTLLEYEVTDPVEDGMTVTIGHNKVITVLADGEKKEVTTEAATVRELLDEMKVLLGEDDIIEPSAENEIKHGDTVTVKRVTYKEEEIKEVLPYETKTEESDSMDAGTSEVTQKGKKGEKTTVIRIKYIDGEEAERETVSEKVTKKPVDEIVTNGTKEPEPEPEPEPAQEESYEYEEPEETYYEPEQPQGRYIVSQVAYPNCDDPSHGYYEITWSDGTVEYVEY